MIRLKISLNDKRVFVVLGILGLAVIYYNIFFIGQQKTIKKYNKDIALFEDSNRDSDLIMSKVAGIDTELKIFNEKLKIVRSMFPPDITQESALVLLKQFSTETGFKIENISFSDMKAVGGSSSPVSTTSSATQTVQNSESVDKKETGKEIEEEDNPSGAQITSTLSNTTISDSKLLKALEVLGIAYGQAGTSSGIPDGKGYSLGLNINGTCTNKQLKNFLYKLKNFKSAISIKSVQINGSKDDELTVNMEIEFIGIADKKAKEQGRFFDVQWSPLNPAGKNDMFKPFEGYGKAEGTNEAVEKSENDVYSNENQYKEYQFSMRVLPFGFETAPPTVTFVGESVPSYESRMPIVYGDSKDNENVELHIEVKNGKYYCKFRTDHEAFPDVAFSGFAEFKAVGKEIKMLIDSSKRVSTNDNSGVVVTVTNNSDKNLVIDVINEDANRPRVSIKKNGSNVIINYK